MISPLLVKFLKDLVNHNMNIVKRDTFSVEFSIASTDVESEDFVVDIVALRSALHEKECLRELEWRLGVAVDVEAARDEHENTVADRGLIVSCGVR